MKVLIFLKSVAAFVGSLTSALSKLMKETETRRLFIDDNVWEKTHSSWKKLKPKKNFNQICHTDETAHDCYKRLFPEFGIPFDIIEQWIYEHYYDCNTVKNYGWIDYWNVNYEKISIKKEIVSKLYVVENYLDYVRERSESDPFDEISCEDIDLNFWKKHKTWRVPPVVIDVKTFDTKPSFSDFKGPLQLVEGHSRLGFFLAMERIGLMDKRDHFVYLIKNKLIDN